MNLDLSQFFTEYESLVAQVDAVFQKVSGNFASEVRCKEGCSDCCHALFDVTLIEAMYLNHKFSELDEIRRNEILIEADKADRKAYLLKKKASKEAGEVDHSEILLRTAKERLRCPLLDSADKCALYAYRPITCRIYGIPLDIGGKSHTCGLSGFEPGRPYPAVKLERIQDMLLSLSNRVLDSVGSQYADFRLMYVPVSTALMTVYSDEFFGTGGVQAEAPIEQGTSEPGGKDV
ncbi:Fe-S-cluster containining protein [Desulfomicrobium macestii]|uniref:Fe-S-cluster containining protein n=1 Tax=Desulfomicrobium macestii TaxID=90731 RepID=A0ABR9H5Z7_9BACT|nr:YkgJ family cysteine cluster protein [Desulfomicrobium macestii]MBE1426143.1 Fe-S-cluster containining protein [Desulfomicrobium macestii]